MDARELKSKIVDVPDFPKPGILFRDIMPLLKDHLAETVELLDAAVPAETWNRIDHVAGIESRGFVLATALALRRGKGFIPVRKQGKLPPPVVDHAYELEYGSGILETNLGSGRLLIVDDVLATGGTLAGAAALGQRAGYEVVELLVLVDLGFVPGFEARGLTPRSIITYP